jgi:hypothetical protein
MPHHGEPKGVNAVKYCLVVLLALALSGCKSNPVDAPKNPREYTWNLEIIHPSEGVSYLAGMYANSSSDIWIARQQYGGSERLYHFDGSAWSPVSSSYGIGTPHHIAGFGKRDLWIVGDQWGSANDRTGFIARYDGYTWSMVKQGGMNMLETVWGSGQSDVWFGGFDGTLLHFDGTSFKPDSIPLAIPVDPKYNWRFSAGASLSPALSYAVLSGQDNKFWTWSCTFKREGSRWVFVDSTIGLVTSLWYGPWGTLYRTGSGISCLDGSIWKSLKLPAWTRGVCGTAEANLIAVGEGHSRRASVYHWNGTDWYEFTNLPTPDFTATEVWTDGREVFVAGDGDDGIYILRGK